MQTMKKIVIIFLFLFSFNLKSQTQDIILSNFNINAELFGITRGLGGINLEYNIYRNPNLFSLYFGNGLYLSFGGFANVTKSSLSFGSVDCIDLSLYLITQLKDLSNNFKPETCDYGTDKTRYGVSIGYRSINKDYKSFWSFQFSLQFSNVECYLQEPNVTGTPRTRKDGVKPIQYEGFTYGLYL